MYGYVEQLAPSSSRGYNGDGKQRGRRIATAQQVDDGFLIDGCPLQQVTLVGAYTSPRVSGTTLRFLLDDGTGQLPCTASTDMSSRMAALWEAMPEQRYIRLFGKVREDRSLSVFHASQVTDHCDVVYHQLSAIHQHLSATRPAQKPQAKLVQAMAPLRSASGPPPPYLTAAASPYTVPHAAHPSFALPLPAFGQGSMVRTGAGSLLQLQPGPASAIAFQPFTSWSPSQLPAEGDIRRAVRSAIRQSSDPLGASIQDIDRSCRGFNLVEIRRELQRMGSDE